MRLQNTLDFRRVKPLTEIRRRHSIHIEQPRLLQRFPKVARRHAGDFNHRSQQVCGRPQADLEAISAVVRRSLVVVLDLLEETCLL